MSDQKKLIFPHNTIRDYWLLVDNSSVIIAPSQVSTLRKSDRDSLRWWSWRSWFEQSSGDTGDRPTVEGEGIPNWTSNFGYYLQGDTVYDPLEDAGLDPAEYGPWLDPFIQSSIAIDLKQYKDLLKISDTSERWIENTPYLFIKSFGVAEKTDAPISMPPTGFIPTFAEINRTCQTLRVKKFDRCEHLNIPFDFEWSDFVNDDFKPFLEQKGTDYFITEKDFLGNYQWGAGQKWLGHTFVFRELGPVGVPDAVLSVYEFAFGLEELSDNPVTYDMLPFEEDGIVFLENQKRYYDLPYEITVPNRNGSSAFADDVGMPYANISPLYSFYEKSYEEVSAKIVDMGRSLNSNFENVLINPYLVEFGSQDANAAILNLDLFSLNGTIPNPLTTEQFQDLLANFSFDNISEYYRSWIAAANALNKAWAGDETLAGGFVAAGALAAAQLLLISNKTYNMMFTTNSASEVTTISNERYGVYPMFIDIEFSTKYPALATNGFELASAFEEFDSMTYPGIYILQSFIEKPEVMADLEAQDFTMSEYLSTESMTTELVTYTNSDYSYATATESAVRPLRTWDLSEWFAAFCIPQSYNTTAPWTTTEPEINNEYLGA